MDLGKFGGGPKLEIEFDLSSFGPTPFPPKSRESRNERLDLASRGLVLGEGERDAKSRHLLSPNEPLDLVSRGLVLGGGSGMPNRGTC